MPNLSFSMNVSGGADFDANALARLLDRLSQRVRTGDEGRFQLFDTAGNPVGRGMLEISDDEISPLANEARP